MKAVKQNVKNRHFTEAKRGARVKQFEAMQGTHKPLVAGSSPAAATLAAIFWELFLHVSGFSSNTNAFDSLKFSLMIESSVNTPFILKMARDNEDQ